MKGVPIAATSMGVALLALGVARSDAQQLVTGFEPAASYTTGSDIGGVDGWTAFGGTRGLVTPDSNSGYTTVLEGSQSFLMYANGGAYGRGFGSAAGQLSAGSTLSWLMRFEIDGTGGGSAAYLSNNIASGQTPAGIEADDTTNQFNVFGLDGSAASGYTFAPNKTYLLEMSLDFVNQRFTGYVTDQTDGGARTSLGSQYFAAPLTASGIASGGGIFLSKTGGSASFVDSIELKSESTPAPDPVDASFGNRWVRQHPLTLFGVPSGQDRWDAAGGIATYAGAGFNTAWTYAPDRYVIDAATGAGMPWHAYVPANTPTAAAQALDAVRTLPGGIAYMIGDEPNRAQLDNYALTAAYVKSAAPQALRYVNALPLVASRAQLRGDSLNDPYSYQQYLSDIMTKVKPDVLMYDFYPYFANGSTDHAHLFQNLQAVRQEALSRGVPYWAWAQSWSSSGSQRLPSESDLRMQLFAHLTAGYTGVGYWTYTKFNGQDSALLDGNNQPTSLYPAAADANAEVQHLGNALRFATSTDLRFVAGTTGGVTNSIPTALSAWTEGAGGDQHIKMIRVSGGGPYNNGLVGFFQDDAGDLLFALTNLSHGAGLLADQTSLTFSVQFDPSISQILELDRETGLQELVLLDSNHNLTLTLPGGTGELFKYDTGNFIVPEPSSLTLACAGAAGLLVRRRGRPARPSITRALRPRS